MYHLRVCVLGHSVVSDCCDPMDCKPPGSLSRILEWVAMPSSRGSSQPRMEARHPALQAVSSPSEPPGKPKNTGVGSLFLLQGNFPTQELNRGLLHCWQILYQLSYQGSPENTTISFREFIPRSSMATSALRGKPSVSSLGHQGDHHLILAISNTTKKLALWKILKN